MTTLSTVDSATLTSQNIGAGSVEIFSKTLAGSDSVLSVAAIRISGRGAATTVDLRLRVLVGGILLADNVVEYLATATTSLEIQTLPFVWRNGETLQIYLSSSSTADSSVGVATVVSTEETAASVDTAAIATASAAAILATPANKLVTNGSGEVVASNFVAAPTAADNATAVVEKVVTGSEGAGAVGTILHAISTMIEFVGGLWRWKGSALSETPTGAGGGQYQITLVADSLAGQVPGTTFSIVGTVLNVTTGSDGEALINLDAGTYTLRTTAPAGYDAVADRTLVVTGDDTETVTVVAIGYTPANPPGCNVTIPVRSQFTAALEGVHVKVKFIAWETGATKPATILSPPPVVITDSSGLASVTLYRLARYQATYTVEGDTTKVVPFTVPDVGTYTVIEP